MKILVTPTSLKPDKNSSALERLGSFCSDLIFNPSEKPLSSEELLPLLKDCDGYLAGLDQVTGPVLKRCPRLRAISRYGAGYDRVDIQTARALGIKVANTPGANAQAVAELSFALLLALARKIPYLHNETASGNWVRSTGTQLHHKTLGIVGLGAIGRKVALCSAGFSMKVLAYDPYVPEHYCIEHGIIPADLDTLLAKADFITLHLPLNDDTYHLINDKSIALMKPGSILVNASRGGIIDEEAAFRALSDGRLGGLGLDAFEHEPPGQNLLFTLPNVIATPHAGAHTREAAEAMAGMAVDNLITMLKGEDCPFLL
ncbi:phosphoglycerate dehydrogenase [Dorea sp. D27]|uniref:phosphoglycerate dehydrogenase n=1 Tax=Dorea sp. D27 TaxID=658665 RepID=UPI00067349A7|nr:phosphoglycerate dehydrogenase [Dorea sp. D27]KMZ53386.1 D-3-phosphoglycerate dehydrogenase [Dorea sp. D27]